MNKQQELAEQIEAILSKTDTCFGDCDNVKECSHTGHGCYLWKQYANEIVEAMDAPAKEVEAISDSEETKAWKDAWERYPDKNELHDALRKIHVERTLNQSKNNYR